MLASSQDDRAGRAGRAASASLVVECVEQLAIASLLLSSQSIDPAIFAPIILLHTRVLTIHTLASSFSRKEISIAPLLLKSQSPRHG